MRRGEARRGEAGRGGARRGEVGRSGEQRGAEGSEGAESVLAHLSIVVEPHLGTRL